jgi:hypothetical protein
MCRGAGRMSAPEHRRTVCSAQRPISTFVRDDDSFAYRSYVRPFPLN